jgi:hypothetical protein
LSYSFNEALGNTRLAKALREGNEDAIFRLTPNARTDIPGNYAAKSLATMRETGYNGWASYTGSLEQPESKGPSVIDVVGAVLVGVFRR